MNGVNVFALAAVVLFGLGLYAMTVGRNLLRRILAFNILGSSTFLVLVASAERTPDGGVDPVPQAMVLTGIVVSISATALALALVRQMHAVTGRAHLPEDVDDDVGREDSGPDFESP